MTKLELTYFSVKCGIVDPDKNTSFVWPYKVLALTA